MYYRHVGEHNQRQRHLGESRVAMVLSHMVKGEWQKRGKKADPSIAARRPKVHKEWVTKMSGLYSEELLGKGSEVHGLEYSG